MPGYFELPPPPELANTIECFWVSRRCRGADTLQRVVPDGRADIIYSRLGSEATLQFVGPMSHHQDFAQLSGTCQIGIRFRPGTWPEVIKVDGSEVLDEIAPLHEFWGSRADQLSRNLENADTLSDMVGILQHAVRPLTKVSTFQQAIQALELSHGMLPLDDVAELAGLSTRQFRRRCITATSLSPKLLARILRFRYAAELAPSMTGSHAELAFECGYANQSHLIADFQQFAGRTPRALLANSE